MRKKGFFSDGKPVVPITSITPPPEKLTADGVLSVIALPYGEREPLAIRIAEDADLGVAPRNIPAGGDVNMQILESHVEDGVTVITKARIV